MAGRTPQRIFLALLWPGLIIGLLPAVLQLRPGLNEQLQPYFSPALLLIAGAGMLLCWRFNRSRLLFGLALLVVSERVWTLTSTLPQADLIQAGITLLLPLNLALFALLPESALLGLPGLWRLALISGQILAAATILRFSPESYATFFNWQPPLPSQLLSGISLPLLIAATVSAVILTARLIHQPSAQSGGLLAALVYALCGLWLPLPLPLPLAFWFGCAGLALLLASIETFHALAFRDELTGLPARRAMQEALKRLGGRYSIAMVDIDHFKKCNDNYGHDVGDQVLKMVAAHLARVGGGGRAYRYGGEEFAVLFPRRDGAKVLDSLELLREQISADAFLLRRWPRPTRKPKTVKPRASQTKKISVTVSIGIAERNPGQTAAEVIKQADKLLYKAKKSGRNQVCG